MSEKFYDTVVIGAGHAGCEAGLALARTGNHVMVLTLNLDAVAFLACNPSIGGTAKGHLVCEIDALGGEMGKNTDKTLLQLRMLNLGKGPAVHSLRAQVDKQRYHDSMKYTLETTPNLDLRQGEAEEILVENGKVVGIKTCQGELIHCKSVVVASGVYLKSRIIIGPYTKECGPNGFQPANSLTTCLKNLGLNIFRFKTGTPARINARSINFGEMQEQLGDKDIQPFSFLTTRTPKSISKCYLTYTCETTHDIIRANLDKCPVFSGEIVGIGPRYCPSIESKVVRFADRDRHQVFLEPESLSTNEYYVQGMSTSMPINIQEEMYKTLAGLKNVEIMRDSYAIEYDCIDSTQLYATLGYKKIAGLYFAGQVNGTSGYEEAAAQGIIAGINASLFNQNKEQLVLKRSDAYIGVLIDDLVTKGTNEPYRMMTSRAEYRLWLRQDNADERLTEIGHKVGLVDEKRYKKFIHKNSQIQKLTKQLSVKIKLDEKLENFITKFNETVPTKSLTVYEMLKRSNITLSDIIKEYNLFTNYPQRVIEAVNINVKYEGYLLQQQEDILKAKKQEDILIPEDFEYSNLKGLRQESIQKLNKIRPTCIGQASRISGVSPADIAVLTVAIKLFKKNNT